MRWIPGGMFRMGSDGFYPEERPVHEVAVDGSGWTTTPLPRPSSGFARETGYATVAERPLNPEEYLDSDPDLLVPGSLVFRKSTGPVDLGDYR